MTASATTVVIATRNRWSELSRTLAETRRAHPRVPIIVVDNGSEDGTPHAVQQQFPGVRVLRLPRNEGAVARNIGVHHARTPYVAFSDDDSWWHAGSLERAEEIFVAHPGIGLIAGHTLVGVDERPDPVVASMAASPLGRPDGLPGPVVLGCTACSAVVRRDAFLAAGGFNRLLFFVAEEKLLAYDLAALGWELVYAASVVAHHHPSSSRGAGDRRVLTELRNNALIAWMRRPLPLALRSTAALLGRAGSPAGLRESLLFGRKLPSALRARAPLPRRVQRQIELLRRTHHP